MGHLRTIKVPTEVITAIDGAVRFPEVLSNCQSKYRYDIQIFKELIADSTSSADLLNRIRSKDYDGDQRMSFLKMFRRSVSPIIDTEMAKKITKVSTAELVRAFGHTFKPIALLKQQFSALTADQEAALAALIGEYDSRGQLGYQLTDMFFNWFEQQFNGQYTIEGPRGAGRDIELSTVFEKYDGNFPCDFVIRKGQKVKAVGFARYDSTRGGAQSDDRTGGNSDKVGKAKEFCRLHGDSFRLIFLADGPGLAHRDTWAEACSLDGIWDDNVRVITLKLAPERLTQEWLG